jgi:Cu(I)/Ag(I) efflux system membrane fusion protein
MDTKTPETEIASAASSLNHASLAPASWRWWLALFIRPALLLVSGIILIAALGLAQRAGFITAGGSGGHNTNTADESIRYICPMMCTPPQSEPGRCPVCAMELVPAASGSGKSDAHSVHIETAARRVANIRTVTVQSTPVERTIRAVGVMSYDEGRLKTISAYVDGRLERLYANYTGVVVKEADSLALVYSPRLYSSQVEFLSARTISPETRSTRLQGVARSTNELLTSARQRLVELGMTDDQIRKLEEAGEANSRLTLLAPMSGTVIEKFAIEGQYVKEGQAIYQLADLSTIWLMLELVPEDAALIGYGRKVEAEVQSLPGQSFAGRVAFIDPRVDPKTRTVGVRVVIPNDDGRLRVGDFAKAKITIPLTTQAGQQVSIFDPELANKWISPRHPHIVQSMPGDCPLCGMALVPATEFGFTSEMNIAEPALTVPRDAVLMSGGTSVLYVETEPGRFELRHVVLGPTCGERIVILGGLRAGESVALRGNFLIDSQMQLAGNPSLIDPTRAISTEEQPIQNESMSAEMLAALSTLSPEDRALVERQRICPVADFPLGSMGTPKKVDVNGTPVFICCEGCRKSLLDEPQKYLDKLAAATSSESIVDSQELSLPPIGAMSAIQANSNQASVIEAHDELPPIMTPQIVVEADSSEHQRSEPVAGLPMEVIR